MKSAILALLMTVLAIGAARAEELRIYNWSDYIAEDTIKQFTEETGIDVVYDVYDSNEVLEAKLLAGNSGYDLVIPTSDFLQRQVAAGIYQPLDKSKLPNLVNMDKTLMANAAKYDANNAHSVIYMWGTTGIGFNVEKVKERLGADFKTDTWDMVFKPEIVAKLADCGVTMLDAPTEMLPAALNYLGLDPNSENKADLEKAAALILNVRQYIRYFHSSQYINDLANGDICVAVGYSGDIYQARDRAAEAENGVTVDYAIPFQGALQWFDLMAIPVDAPNPDAAHKFINFIMKPQVTADITNYVWYASANKKAMPLIEDEIKTNRGIFPSQDTVSHLWAAKPLGPKANRLTTRLWTNVKTGQ